MTNERQPQEIPEWQRQAWLVEYQVCQHDSSAMVNIQWTVAGIFMTANTAMFGWILKNVISENTLLESNRCFVLILGIGIIILNILLWQWLERVSNLVRINNRRMTQIERRLGMSKNRMLERYDHHIHCPSCLKGIWFARCLCVLMFILWIIIIAIIL